MFTFSGAFSSIKYVVAALALAYLYNIFENRKIVSNARAGYVTEVRLATLAGQLSESKRQAQAAQQSSDLFQEALVKVRIEEEANAISTEEAIAAYRKANGPVTDCRAINNNDLDFLNGP
jgi:hypothetical protein